MHFLQSPAWEKFQSDLQRATFRRQGDGWQFLAVLEHGKGNTRLYCPYGPSATNLDSFKEALVALRQLAIEQKVTFVRIEPTDASFIDYLAANAWQKVTYQSLNPEYTNVIDLSPAPEELVANMSASIRNIYRNYHKKSITIHQSNDPADCQIFINLIHQVASKTGLRPHSDDYFMTQARSLFPIGAATLWYAALNNQPIASAIFYNDESSRYNAHAAASTLPEHRRLKAGTALLAEAIVDAKNQGMKSFDMYGVAPPEADASHPWQGFSDFKRSFGGQDIHFTGSWDLPIKKAGYLVYRNYQKLRR